MVRRGRDRSVVHGYLDCSEGGLRSGLLVTRGTGIENVWVESCLIRPESSEGVRAHLAPQLTGRTSVNTQDACDPAVRISNHRSTSAPADASSADIESLWPWIFSSILRQWASEGTTADSCPYDRSIMRLMLCDIIRSVARGE